VQFVAPRAVHHGVAYGFGRVSPAFGRCNGGFCAGYDRLDCGGSGFTGRSCGAFRDGGDCRSCFAHGSIPKSRKRRSSASNLFASNCILSASRRGSGYKS
jgi:hypothetical protein